MPVGRDRGTRARERTKESRGWNHDWLWCIALIAAVFIAYWPAINGTQLWDDEAHLTRPELQSLTGLARIWFDLGATQQYYPLTHSAFWIEHRLWGDWYTGYHLVNILLHAASALLIVGIMRRLSLPGAWLGGFLFALHPVCVEAVAWMSEQKSTLSTVFYLASLLVYLRFDETRRKSQYALALLLFLMAMAAKTVTATLPAALLVILWWKRGGLDLKRDVLPLIPWLAVGVAAGTFTAWVETDLIGAKGSQFTLSWIDRCLIAGRVVWFYVAKIFGPVDLIFSYPRWAIDVSAWWQYLFPAALVAALVLFSTWARRGQRGPLAAALLFIGTLVPVLGFLNVYPFVFSFVADHFQYLAMIAVIVPVAVLLTNLETRLPGKARIVRAACGAAIVLLALGTSSQAANYTDSETLYRSVIARNPGSLLAHYNLGVALSTNPSRAGDAIAELKAEIGIDPSNAGPHYDLGRLLGEIPGRANEAIAEDEMAIRLKPNYADAENNLGKVFLTLPDRTAEGIAHLRKAVALDPQLFQAQNNLGGSLLRVPGNLKEAIEHLKAAIALNPNSLDPRVGLAMAYAMMPETAEEAIREYQEILRLHPESAEAHYGLGFLLSSRPGGMPQAIEHYRAAVRIRPELAEAQYGLGTVLSDVPGSLPEAIEHLRAALQLNPQFADARLNLGLALLRTKDPQRRAEATAEIENAVRGRPDLASPFIRNLLVHLRARR